MSVILDDLGIPFTTRHGNTYWLPVRTLVRAVMAEIMETSHGLTVDERLEQLVKRYPGSTLSHRMWAIPDASGMQHTLQLTANDESWSATGESLGLTYCELLRKMTMDA